jgi:hypothetical protein
VWRPDLPSGALLLPEDDGRFAEVAAVDAFKPKAVEDDDEERAALRDSGEKAAWRRDERETRKARICGPFL